MELERTGAIWDRSNRNGLNENWNKLESILSNFDGTKFFEESYNLFNKDTVVSGTLSGSTGEVNPSGFVTSDFIRVVPNTFVMVTTPGITVLYDANRNYIRQIPASQYPFMLPENAHFLRTTMSQNSVDSKMVYLGSDQDRPYKPYGVEWSDGIFDTEFFEKVEEGLENLGEVKVSLRNFVQSVMEQGFIPQYENLFDGSAIVAGVLSGITGEVNDHDTFVTSDFMPVTPGDYVRVEPSAGITVLYDRDKRYLRQIGSNSYPFLIPSDAWYMRTTMNRNSVSGKYVYLGVEDMDYKPYYGGQNQSTDKPLKILTIGNSYSVDTFMHFYDICQSAGVNVVVGIAHEPGGSLEEHMGKINNNESIHSYYKWSTAGRYVRQANALTTDVIKDEEWDIILFQQASTLSADYSTYQPHLTNLKNYARDNATNPKVRFGINMIWPRPVSNVGVGTPEKQLEIYNDIVDANQKAAFDTDLEIFIPTGTALMNGRGNSYLAEVSNELTRDNSHLNEPVGQYLAAMTVFITLFGESAFGDVSYATSANKHHLYLSKLSAQKAVNNPFIVSKV